MRYPALDVEGADSGLLLAAVDEWSPLALDDAPPRLTVFFATAADRDHARRAVVHEFPDAVATSRDVDDEDWARRSQQNLQAVTIGRVTIAPPWAPRPPASNLKPPTSSLQPPPLTVIIEPSMGFGTGHHATTRLCVAALQALELGGGFVIDVGTGSGVLAITARLLGSGSALGIDTDPDAIRSAADNLRLNPGINGVVFELGDLTTWLPLSHGRVPVDLVTANLTGALLVRSAGLLVDAVRPGGHLILSGLMESERIDVEAAFRERTNTVAITSEDEWVALLLRKP